MMTPQTMAVITRIFPADRRGQAMALWGATAGVATLVGPILGGILVDALGWEWIFFINIPVGMVGFVLACGWCRRCRPTPTSFDWLGVALSGARHVPAGLRHPGGPQVPLERLGDGLDHRPASRSSRCSCVWQSPQPRASRWCRCSLFRDRNFSISNFAISTMSFTATAMGFPIMLYAQLVRGYSPLESALLFVPMAVMSIVLAPIVGRFTDRVHPRVLYGARASRSPPSRSSCSRAR